MTTECICNPPSHSGHYSYCPLNAFGSDPDAANSAAPYAEAIITAVAVRLHDLDCPDRKCSGPALGEYYRRACLVLDDVEPLIKTEATARERQRPLVLVWRDERNNEICRSTPLTRGATRIAIPLDASHADLVAGPEKAATSE